jgi:hypothetical protein
MIVAVGSAVYRGAVVDLLQRMKKKRHVADYEVAGSLSDAGARQMHGLALRIRNHVEAWLRANHPGLLNG